MQVESTVRPNANYAPPKRLPDVAVVARASSFIPTLLLGLAFVAWLGFQATQQLMERQQLTLAQATLEPQELAANKLRASLEAVATSTARLATAGNVNARVIVEELRKRGVTINAPAAAAPK